MQIKKSFHVAAKTRAACSLTAHSIFIQLLDKRRVLSSNCVGWTVNVVVFLLHTECLGSEYQVPELGEQSQNTFSWVFCTTPPINARTR